MSTQGNEAYKACLEKAAQEIENFLPELDTLEEFDRETEGFSEAEMEEWAAREQEEKEKPSL